MKKAVLFFSAFAVIAIGAASFASNMQTTEAVKNIRREYRTQAKFDFERYKDLKEGMSLAEVTTLLGREGSVMASAQSEGIKDEGRWWFNDPDNLMITFQNGHAVGYVALQGTKLISQGWMHE